MQRWMSLPSLVAAGLALAACQASLPSLPVPHLSANPDVTRLVSDVPPGAEPGSCWGKRITPGVYETVTQQIMLQPAEVLGDGTVLSPAIYKTETRQAVVSERRESWFEVPCTTMFTPEFVATLQRALMARGLFRADVTGILDNRTKTAIRRFQRPNGFDSDILTLDSARQLGLVAVARNGI